MVKCCISPDGQYLVSGSENGLPFIWDATLEAPIESTKYECNFQDIVSDCDWKEIVIDQVMSLEDSKLSIDDLKWVVMMVIGNSAESAVPSQWIESIVFHDDNPTLQ